MADTAPGGGRPASRTASRQSGRGSTSGSTSARAPPPAAAAAAAGGAAAGAGAADLDGLAVSGGRYGGSSRSSLAAGAAGAAGATAGGATGQMPTQPPAVPTKGSQRNGLALKPFTVTAEQAIPAQPEPVRKRRTKGWLSFSTRLPQTDSLDAELAQTLSARERTEALHGTRRPASQPVVPPAPPRKVLDGFLLLERSSAELPAQATRVVINDADLCDVVQDDDFSFFTNLSYVDLGDNQLSLDRLTALPAVVEMRLHCNGMRSIGDLSGAFHKMEVLDLSYNALDIPSIENLAVLPNLRELDLTCNGLDALPESMAGFKRLEVLILERNRLSGDACMLSLCKAPRLRELNLASNYIKGVPLEAATAASFRMLEWLNLADNLIAAESDILSLVRLPRLLQVILYGNPITHNTSKRADAPSHNMLNEQETAGKIVNLVTDAPTPVLPNRRPSRAGAYSNFRITKVVDHAAGSANGWREAGNRYLFGDDGAESPTAFDALPRASPTRQRKPRGDEKTTIFMTATNDDGASVYSDESEQEEEEDPSLEVPVMLLQRSLQGPVQQSDPAKLRAAVNALRQALRNTSTLDYGRAKNHHQRPTKLQTMRQRPVRPYIPGQGTGRGGGGGEAALGVTRHHIRGATVDTDEGDAGFDGRTSQTLRGAGAASLGLSRHAEPGFGSLQAMEALLERMDANMAGVEDELAAAAHHDKSMGMLMDMVGRVMETYE